MERQGANSLNFTPKTNRIMSLIRLALIFCLLLVLCSCGSDSASTPAPAPSADTAPAVAPPEAPDEILNRSDVPTEDFTFVPNERFGKITASTKPEDIPALYGDEALPTNDIHLGEGMMTSGYLLYAGTKNRAEIIVPDEENGMENLVVRISMKGGDWHPEGMNLHVGTALAELNELNGKTFDLYGYEWDYGGTVADWKDGKLTGIGVVTAYDNLKFVGDNADQRLLGDHVLSSDDPALEKIGVTVSEIVIGLK